MTHYTRITISCPLDIKTMKLHLRMICFFITPQKISKNMVLLGLNYLHIEYAELPTSSCTAPGKNKKGELQVRTAHSLNPVPFIIYEKKNTYTIKEGSYGLANVAPTIATILKLKTPECWEESMI